MLWSCFCWAPGNQHSPIHSFARSQPTLHSSPRARQWSHKSETSFRKSSFVKQPSATGDSRLSTLKKSKDPGVNFRYMMGRDPNLVETRLEHLSTLQNNMPGQVATLKNLQTRLYQRAATKRKKYISLIITTAKSNLKQETNTRPAKSQSCATLRALILYEQMIAEVRFRWWLWAHKVSMGWKHLF